MPKSIYIGMHGSWDPDEEDDQIYELLTRYGKVTSIQRDRSGGYVIEMASGADEAVLALNGQNVRGTRLDVRQMRSR